MLKLLAIMISPLTIAVLIVAAGKSQRFAGDRPKQYCLAAGKPILRWSLVKFRSLPQIGPIMVVIDPDHEAWFDEARADISDIHRTPGGATRQESVLRGLEALSSCKPDFVLIHDAARANVHIDDLKNLIDRLAKNPKSGFALAHKVTDSLHRDTETVSRDHLWAAETPQGFAYADILAAHRELASQGFTDDIAIYRAHGKAVEFIESRNDNFKITYQQDLDRLEAMCTPTPRVGYGYDVHALIDGNGVTLAGVKIPHHKSLDGHSDADVVLHAITDALLGTCGAGDIGLHFPPSDARWKNAKSKLFLQKALDLVQQHHGQLSNIDVSIIAEEPKIGPHRQAMQQKLAELTGLDTIQVNIKATTNEKMGFVGRGEGIAAHAVATVLYRKAA